MINKSGLVSVIIPTFNCKNVIGQAVKSVLDQTYNNLEVIIIDDGSTDDTKTILTPYLKDKRVKYFKQINLGQASARNKGLSMAQGAFIAFLDSDDYWLPSKISQQISRLLISGNSVSYTNFKIINGVTGCTIPYHRGTEYEQFRYGDVKFWLSFYNFIPFSSVIVHRTLLEKTGGLNEKIEMGDDWDLLLRLSMFSDFDFIEEPLLVYRMGRPKQLSGNMKKRFEQQELIISNFYKNFPNSFSKQHIKKTASIRFTFRGRFYSKFDFKTSLIMYLNAIRLFPINILAFKGILRLFIIWIFFKKSLN